MIPQPEHTCALGVSDATLSALRDAAVSPARARRLAAHTRACPACAARLDAFERVGRALREQRLAGPPDRLWAEISASITAERAPGRRRNTRARSAARGASALAAALIVTLLFGLVIHSIHRGGGPSAPARTPVASVTATATATAIPPTPTLSALITRPLTWSRYTLPDGYILAGNSTGIAVAPSDGNTAYVCKADVQANAPASPVIVTHDRGAHWIEAGSVPINCYNAPVVADQLEPQTVALGQGDGIYVTRDGGATWNRLTQPDGLYDVSSLATRGTRTYALMAVSNGVNGATPRLEVSDDGMRSWRVIGDSLAGGQPRAFWVDPSGESLFLATETLMWRSDDSGQHWRQIPLDGGLVEDYAARFINGAWRICSFIACSSDDGQTWSATPRLSLGNGGTRVALAGDGALLATSTSNGGVYRLPAGGDRWEALGTQPDATYYVVFTATSSGAGSTVLWCLPLGGRGAHTLVYSAAL